METIELKNKLSQQKEKVINMEEFLKDVQVERSTLELLYAEIDVSTKYFILISKKGINK